MDHYSILDGDSSPAPSPTIKPDAVEAGQAPLPTASGGGQPPPLRFPGDDGGKSLAEIARRDLDAALQLLAERALRQWTHCPPRSDDLRQTYRADVLDWLRQRDDQH
jgi:hypothetical protein